ncbi:MAG: hypothetical protein ABS99_06870 [Acetobacteraceae bacterium SCN 69-10]|nr:MAG: hypothetical protein ABS99_06870 [Acetobacteraceae bacterium SCN 69-10]
MLMPHARDMLPAAEEVTDDSVAAAGQELRARHGFGALLVKRGEEGLSLVDAEGAHHYRLNPTELVDLSGAGDAALATLAAGLAVANAAAGLIGATPGSGVAQAAGLLEAVALEDARARG